ncbi:MAG: hypothetical protein JSV86_21005 [Gemmatimonadota bacterium]|nr:MAG: hypothetical protein JSV86_21005 [Gemmatimonadota bacterium]
MKKVLAVAGLWVVLLCPSSLDAQLALAGQGSWTEDFDFGIGARAIARLPIDAVPTALVGSFDWFFPDDEIADDYWEINANLIATPALEIVSVYFGTGLNIAHVKAPEVGGGGSTTEVGVNLLGGLMYDAAFFVPYGEVRYEIEGGEQFVVTVGIALRLVAATGIR